MLHKVKPFIEMQYLQCSLRLWTSKIKSKLGSCIHAKILKSGLDSVVLINNILLDMYTNCDQIDDAAYVFDILPQRIVVSWNSMMSGYCQKGPVDEVRMLGSLPSDE